MTSEQLCTGDCERGWRAVSDVYVDRRIAGYVTNLDPAKVAAVRRQAQESVYPCPSCRPQQYERWVRGHLDSGHTCPECTPVKRRRAS